MPTLRRMTALALAFAGWSLSAVVFLISLVWGIGLRCDDSCGGPGWRRSSAGWQWDGVVALGALSLLAGTVLLVLVWRRRTNYAVISFGVGLGAALALVAALSG